MFIAFYKNIHTNTFRSGLIFITFKIKNTFFLGFVLIVNKKLVGFADLSE